MSIRRRNLERDLIAFSVIDDLPARCLHPGCNWEGSYSLVKKHQRGCEFRPIKTVHSGGEMITVEDYEPSN
jgi:hypothetical protein